MKIEINKKLTAENDMAAEDNRRLFLEKGVYVINLLGSPGAGKTSMLEALIPVIDDLKLAVIEGDLYTERDAERIERYDIPVIQLNTGGICHLEAAMVAEALKELDLDNLDVIIIENVGNLICTASFDLGEDNLITVLSVTEGTDKPEKYPHIFEKSDLVIISKIDLLEMTDFDIIKTKQNLELLKKDMRIIELCSKEGQGVEDLVSFLKSRYSCKQNP